MLDQLQTSKELTTSLERIAAQIAEQNALKKKCDEDRAYAAVEAVNGGAGAGISLAEVDERERAIESTLRNLRLAEDLLKAKRVEAWKREAAAADVDYREKINEERAALFAIDEEFAASLTAIGNLLDRRQAQAGKVAELFRLRALGPHASEEARRAKVLHDENQPGWVPPAIEAQILHGIGLRWFPTKVDPMLTPKPEQTVLTLDARRFPAA